MESVLSTEQQTFLLDLARRAIEHYLDKNKPPKIETEDAVLREVKEETGLNTTIESLLGIYSDPDRDPRGHTVSIVYLLSLKGGTLRGGDDALLAKFFEIDTMPSLAFDHKKIIKEATYTLHYGV